MTVQLSPTLVSRNVVRVIRLTRRPKLNNEPNTAAPARGDEVVRVTPFIRLDPDAEPGRGRLGHCY
jgi:hypothetical protein